MKAKELGAIITVLAFVVLSFFAGGMSSHTTITTTRTVLFSSSAGSPVVTEEVIVQSQFVNEICYIYPMNTTTTFYLAPASSATSSIENRTSSTTTETLRAITTATIYDNVTEVNSGTTCALANPYYNATQSATCPPCA